MRCPKCHEPIHENAAACPSCGFSLDALGSGFGKVPRLPERLNDSSRILRPHERRSLTCKINHFSRQFPQIRFAVALRNLDEDIDLAEYAFWVFNRSELCSDLEKGGLNFYMLLLIDFKHNRANLSIGYGLDPFISNQALTQMVGAGEEALAQGHYAAAISAILDESARVLHEISEAIPATYGINPKDRS